MFHAAAVIGEASSLDAAQDPGNQWPLLRVGEHEAESAREDLVPADLGELIAFVAALLAVFGEGLEARNLILSGSWTAQALAISPGQAAPAKRAPLSVERDRIRE